MKIIKSKSHYSIIPPSILPRRNRVHGKWIGLSKFRYQGYSDPDIKPKSIKLEMFDGFNFKIYFLFISKADLLKEKEREKWWEGKRKRLRERSLPSAVSLYRCLLQQLKAGLVWSQEPGVSFGFPPWVQKPKDIRHILLLFSGRWIGIGVAGTWTSTSMRCQHGRQRVSILCLPQF